MSGVFARLGYNPNSPANNAVMEFSANVSNQMNLMPSFLQPWQEADMANNAVGGYFMNPVDNVVRKIWNTSNTLITLTYQLSSPNIDTNTALITTNTVGVIVSTETCGNYIYHTDRMSNVVDIGTDGVNPHYQMSVGVGKMMTYLTNQTDGIQNNAPMLGGFSSILVANSLMVMSNTLSNLTNILANTITTTVVDENVSNTSNISLTNALALQNSITEIQTTLDGYRASDTNFYNNSKVILSEFNTLRQFNTIGQTENELIMNYIGTDKIKTRLSANTANT